MDKELLQKKIKNEITYMFEKILDFVEVVVADDQQYMKLRGKILRKGNDCIRNINGHIDRSTWFTIDQDKGD